MNVITSLVCAALLASATPAWAEVTRDQAASLAQRQSGGRVLAVERATDIDGRPVWRVKVVTANGDVRVILVDVATGRPM